MQRYSCYASEFKGQESLEKVFPTVEEAKKEYPTKLAEVQKNYSTDDPKIGDAECSYADSGFKCMFIKNNGIGITDISSGL